MDFSSQYEAIKQIADQIYANPELGYKETNTKELVLDYLTQVNPNIDVQHFSTTGFRTTLGSGEKPLHIAFIAELDAVYAPSHFRAGAENGAAHNCGHYTQVAIALALYQQLFESGRYEAFDYKLSFIFVPAEEYLDLAYREELRRAGTITHYGGKPEAVRLGVFDDIDISMCVHAIGGEFEQRTVEVNSDLAGFLYKKYHFQGKASHAGLDPFSSVNAYNISTLFNTAVGLSRQQLNEKEMVRMNPIVMDADMSTNIVPNRMTVGTDLRTQSLDYMKEAAERLDRAAEGSSHALMGDVDIETQMGYLPFKQDRYLSTFAAAAFEKNDQIPQLMSNNPISAAGDIGDLSYMMPCIQIGYSGFTGTIHGDDFIDIDPVFIYQIFPQFLAEVLEEMNGNIEQEKVYRRSYEDYLDVIASITE